jgi:hypothetical protein
MVAASGELMSDQNIQDQEPPIQGARLLKRAIEQFRQLESVGVERDVAGNRKLLYSHYAGLVLLSLFNPAMQSVRGLADASKLRKVQKLIGNQKVSVGSFSESVRVFDPEHLRVIFEQSLESSPAAVTGAGPRRNIPEQIPDQLLERLRIVDGSALRALPQIVEAVSAEANGKWRLHLQFEPLPGTPAKLELRPDETGGDDDERVVLAKNLVAGKVYVGDRGYEKYSLFHEIVTARSDYIIRGQSSRPATVLESRTLDDEARIARVISDEIVQLSPSRSNPLNHTVRRIVIAGRSQGRVRTDRPNSEEIILLTSLVDVPAHVIAAIYELRWSIELFFRWLKHLLGCQHLISCKSEGIGVQVYVALIAALILAGQTKGTVGKRAFNLICLYLQGWADDDELRAGLDAICRAAQKR